MSINPNLYNTVYNPDVLSCIANLSNDEVFTPPDVANAMLDMLPQELFSNPNSKFLDPACKSGVFLREIAKRLLIGLEDKIPDLQTRVDHIFHEQLYGIAITELTSLLSRRSLYCSKYPNSKYSASQFDSVQGNIRFKNTPHRWINGKCAFCGASESEYGGKRREGMETHAYEFIHTIKPQEIWKMKFDVIIGNPPYQLNDGGYGKSAKPIYHLFINQSKKLNPRYLTMVIPSRWFTGGRGLEEFRQTMLSDKHIRKLVDYENFRDIFPGVDLAGGACYFLWDRENVGACDVTNCANGMEENTVSRFLDEFSVFIRSNRALSIVRKVMESHKGNYLDKVVSASKPFGLRTFYEPKEQGIPCQFIQKIGLKYADPSDVTDSFGLLNKWKYVVPRSPIAGQTDFSKPVGFYYDGNTRILPPGTCCTESFIVLFASDREEEVRAFKTYIYTKIARFLLLQCVVSQDVTREKFRFVPALDKYEGIYSDEILRELWNIDEIEWEYINTKIATITETGFASE